MRELQNRVAQGVALLDREEPGWANKVNPETLDLSDIGQCVMGQLYGDFNCGRDKLWTRTKACVTMTQEQFAVAFGFQAQAFFHYPILTAAWKEAILARRDPPVVTWQHRVARKAREVATTVVAFLV